MISLTSAIENTVPLSQFNRGLAGQIFTDVRANGPKVVMRNNSAEVVILPPDEYLQIMDDLNDYLLLTKAVERMDHFDPSVLISEEEMDERLGITEDDLLGFEEVEIE